MLDNKGNNKTEIIETPYRLPEKTVVSTPEINTAVTVTTEINAADRPVFLNLIYFAFLFIVMIIIAYIVLKHPK